jgi:hypothetical protein
MATWIIILVVVLILVLFTAVQGPSSGIVESFADQDPTTALVALDPNTRSKVAVVGDKFYDDLLLAGKNRSTDCDAYEQAIKNLDVAMSLQGLSFGHQESIFYHVAQKNPGFLSGFTLGHCIPNAPVSTATPSALPSGTPVATTPNTYTISSALPSGTPVVMPSPTSSPTTLVQQIRANIGGGNQCLTVLNGRHEAGNAIVQWPCSPTDPNQVFLGNKTAGSNGTQLASNVNKALCVAPGADNNGSKLIMKTCDPADPLRKWTYDSAHASLRAGGPNGRCADINYGLRVNNGPVQLWDCNGWSFAQGVALY